MSGMIDPKAVAQVGIPFGIATLGALVWLDYLSLTPILFGVILLLFFPLGYCVGRERAGNASSTECLKTK